MSGREADPQPSDSETTSAALTLASRFPNLSNPSDPLWPIRLSAESVRSDAAASLPQMVAALSEPIQPVGFDQVKAMFEQTPSPSGQAWILSREDVTEGGYSFSTPPCTTEYGDGRMLVSGQNYHFDAQGRVTTIERIPASPSLAVFPDARLQFSYDDKGYLTQSRAWERYHGSTVDQYEYIDGPDDHKIPALMIRRARQDSSADIRPKPMIVDLLHYQEWLDADPLGYKRPTPEASKLEALSVGDVAEQVSYSGILFKDPAELETALVCFATSDYFAVSLSAETAEPYEQMSEGEGDAENEPPLYSPAAMHDYVRHALTNKVELCWDDIQRNNDVSTVAETYFNFDYFQPGNLSNIRGTVKITQNGVELFFEHRYKEDDEKEIARAFNKTLGMRQIIIEAPVTQLTSEDQFALDLAAVSERLDLPAAGIVDVPGFLSSYAADRSSRTIFSNNRDAVFFQAHSEGLSVEAALLTTRIDEDTSYALHDLFMVDGTTIRGPLPKNIHNLRGRNDIVPKIAITITPDGDPYSSATHSRAIQEALHYITRLEQVEA